MIVIRDKIFAMISLEIENILRVDENISDFNFLADDLVFDWDRINHIFSDSGEKSVNQSSDQ